MSLHTLATIVNVLAPVEMDFTGLYERIFGRDYTDAELDAQDGRNGREVFVNKDPRVLARFYATPPRVPFCLRAVCRRTI